MQIPSFLKLEYMKKWQKWIVAFGIAVILGALYIVGFYYGFQGGFEAGYVECSNNCLMPIK